jgi:NAD(P)-dependent dehydrogenase (short-subunit alcohol dehydrogenase family)
MQSLNKKSTALDVLKGLTKGQKLASYINLGSSAGKQPAVAIVTGGSSGIGIPSVKTLAMANMKVVLCARNLEAAKKVVESLPSSSRNNVRIQKLDLANMKSIQSAAEEILQKEGKAGGIHVLLNNAGVMAPPKQGTAQDLELQFGTNHVGHHMFTRLLLPVINEGGRVVTVASSAHSFGELNFQNLNYETDGATKEKRKYSAWGAYGQSKLANILFAKGLSDELQIANSSIKSVSLHPGVIGTNLWRYLPKWTRPFLNALLTNKNVEQGAATSVYCCLVDGNEFEGGEYLSDCHIEEPKKFGKDESGTLRKKLWDATEKMIEENGFSLPNPIRK